MKILYAGGLKEGGADYFRMLARRLGHQVVTLDRNQYSVQNPLMHKVLFRLAAGPHATRFNRDLFALAATEKPEVLWAEKLLLLTPRTLKAISRLGITTVSYMIDNPFGPRRDPGWRTYLKALPFYDLHVQQRDVSLNAYKAHGAKDVIKVLIGFEPTVHYPSPSPIPDSDREREVSFIGHSYDERARILTQVSEAGLPVTVSGSERVWRRALSPQAFSAMFRKGDFWGDSYRKAIWNSKINLSFLTHSNQDEYTQKTFEIAGCGEFMIVERSEGHTSRFKEDEECVFFSTAEELIEKIRRYLPDEPARRRIAAAGRARALRDGYDNDSQMRKVISRVEQIVAAKRREQQSA